MPDPTSTTSTSTAGPAATPDRQPKFGLFPKLPPELRLKIWNLVHPSRVIEVIFKRDHRKNNYKFLATVPAILHTNHEARVEGLRRYKHVFKTKWTLNGGVFFDLETDILHFSRAASRAQKNLFLRKIKPTELAKVQNFAVQNWSDFCQVDLFTGMKKLILLCPINLENIQTLGKHECGVAGVDVGIHEMEDLMARYPDQQGTLKVALSYTQGWYAQCVRSSSKFWQESKGCKLVYVVECGGTPQRPYWLL